MKVIDAVWEKENLGVETKEVVIEYCDCKKDVLKTLAEIKGEYLVVKVPSDYEPISYELFENGFVFMETMNQISNDLVLKQLSGKKLDIVQNTQFVKMNEADFVYMCDKIVNDLMFKTDRIARDPHFSLKQANQRYVNWLIQERARGAEFFKYIYHGENVGFDCFRKIEDEVFEDFFSGIYKEYNGQGLSVNVPYKLHDYVVAAGGKRIIGFVSSTNVKALSKNINNGYTIVGSNYIFVKHNSTKI